MATARIDQTAPTAGAMASEGGDRSEREEPPRGLHARSFKLRFAAQREPSRSYVSLARPLNLPATVTDKFYSGARPGDADEAAEERALQRVRDAMARGPRDAHPAPLTTSHEYGWWAGLGAARADRRLAHHIRDSAWLRARLAVLAEDERLRRA